MKRTILYLFALLICSISAMAQTPTDNIYVYRNDGRFNAFYSGEVDSLVYSKKDLKGVEHPDVVVQEFWTPDSVYRIPLSVIDSISVTTPEVKYAPKVKKLSPDYVPYIKSVEDMQITFSNDLPYALRINKGDILLYEQFDELFRNGFAGRVVSMDSTGDSMEVGCEAVELTDIYEQNISVGYYSVEQDPDNTELYRLSPATREYTPFTNIPVSINLHLDNGLDITGLSQTAFFVRAMTYITPQTAHIEFTSTATTSLGVDVGGSIKIGSSIKNIFPSLVNLRFPIPNTMLLGGLSIAPFADAELAGKLALNIGFETTQSVTVAYDDGKITTSRNPRNLDWTFGGSLEATGDLFFGLQLSPGITTIGDLVEVEVPVKYGPHLDFDIKGEIFNIGTPASNLYDRMKDSNYSICQRVGIEVECRDRFFHKDGNIIGGRYFDVGKTTYYLWPEFKDLEVEGDSKSITVQATAFKCVLIPCEVGFRIFDEEGKEVDSYYSTEKKNITTPELKYGHTFTKNLKAGEKYTVRPLVRLFGIEMEASPEEECYLDCSLSTGVSNAAMNSFEASGTIESDVPSNVEVGFVYTSEKVKPTVENAKSFKATFVEPNLFKGVTSGLQQGTTYYYRAYVHYNDHYYYGDTQCVTTKRSIDLVDEDNPGGGSTATSKAYVSTGYSADVEMKSAKIGLTYNVISPVTECGYYLQADSKKGKTLTAQYCPLGTVTGNQTIELTGLLPNTKYTYWAKAKNSNGEVEGQKRTFKTLPSPEPVSEILDITDVTMQSATVKCYFDNYQEAKECGIMYEEGDFSYKEKCRPEADGTAKITLSKLTAETEYTLTPYVEVEEEDEVFKGESQELETLGPDITGWWVFNDGQGGEGGRIHDVEFRSSGRTNNFYGVNYLTWERTGHKLYMRWCTPYESNSYWEYRGTFNEDFTKVTGEAVYVFDFEPSDTYDEMIKSTFYLRRK